MELPLGYTEKFSPKKNAPRSEREEVLQKFLERLNHSRKEAGIPPMSYGRLAKIFTGVPTSDLYPFYKTCEGARSFSRFFWWRVNKKT